MRLAMNCETSTSPAFPAGIPKRRLDHDLNSACGSVLCFGQLQAITTANPLWQEFLINRLAVESRYERLLSLYTDSFAAFFGGYLPIDFKARSSQVMKPATTCRMVLTMAAFALAESSNAALEAIDESTALKLLNWDIPQIKAPRWALLSDSLAPTSCMSSTSSSPLARPPWDTPSSNRDRVNPAKRDTIILNASNTSQADLRSQVDAAKENGCIGVIVEVVENNYNGRVLEPAILKRVRRVCAEKSLLFAVDENLTAIRCGAPFSFQREEYAEIEPPDMVFFGGSLSVAGSAINFGAPFFRAMGITGARSRRAVRQWQSQVAKPLPTAVLIQALALIDLARSGNFPMLSRIIGKAIRDFVMDSAAARGREEQPQDMLGGLESFIFVRKDVAGELLVMGASTAAPWIPWVKWFPRLERDMSRHEVLEETLGSMSRPARESASRMLLDEGSKPPWCFWCGNRATNRRHEWCQTCCIDVCEAEACVGQLLKHKCVS